MYLRRGLLWTFHIANSTSSGRHRSHTTIPSFTRIAFASTTTTTGTTGTNAAVITVTNTGTISLDVDPIVSKLGAITTKLASLAPKEVGVLNTKNTIYSFRVEEQEVARVKVNSDHDSVTVYGGSYTNNAKLSVTVSLAEK